MGEFFPHQTGCASGRWKSMANFVFLSILKTVQQYAESDLTKIITIYEPDPNEWIEHRKRR
jgi:hypothetical protein